MATTFTVNGTTFTKHFDNYAADLLSDTRRDKYGRTVHHISLNEQGQVRNTRVVIVKLPQAAIEHHDGLAYLVNDWQHPLYIGTTGVKPDQTGKVTYVRTLKEARELAIAKIANPHPDIAWSEAGRFL